MARAVGTTLGPLTLDRYELSIGTSGGGVAAGLGIAATLALGPVELSVAGVGVRAAVEPGPGNLGAADLALRATPPNGVGVVIDAEVVRGGGFVQRDAAGEYVGALELQLGKIGVKAIGVLSTGPGDWSLLLLLYAQIPPVQLGFGFTLEGIGGADRRPARRGRHAAGRRDEDRRVRRHPVPGRPGRRRAADHRRAAHAVPACGGTP